MFLHVVVKICRHNINISIWRTILKTKLIKAVCIWIHEEKRSFPSFQTFDYLMTFSKYYNYPKFRKKDQWVPIFALQYLHLFTKNKYINISEDIDQVIVCYSLNNEKYVHIVLTLPERRENCFNTLLLIYLIHLLIN